MKLINQSVEYLPQPEGIIGIYQQIERAARTCYKSENKSDGNSMAFVSKLQSMKHNAMLEHGTVYLKCIKTKDAENPLLKYMLDKYSKVTTWYNDWYPPTLELCVTTNYRVLVENNWVDDIQYYLCKPTEYHQKRYTFRLTTSIGIVRELLRHRVFSFANESTRYVNYNKRGELVFITPHWLQDSEQEPYDKFMDFCYEAEDTYNGLVDCGYSPQQAREVLPLCTKSELVMTGFEEDWKNFLDVRLRGTTGKPHPDMIVLAQMIQDEFDKIQNKQ